MDARINAAAVGKNLQDHPLIRLVYKTRVPSHSLTGGLVQKLRIASDFMLYRRGPLASTFEACAFLKTSPKLKHPDIQLHFLTMGAMNSGRSNSPFLGYPSVSVYVNKNYPKSRGQIQLASAAAFDAPSIQCHLMGESDDVETLVRGVDTVRNIMATSPLRELVEAEVLPGEDHLSRESLRQYVSSHSEIAYHAAGTCRMGPDSSAVVNPRLQVNGVDNLWLADASIMPDLISGNTNAVSMLIGMKLGRQLRECQ